jgi:hypothetical protein
MTVKPVDGEVAAKKLPFLGGRGERERCMVWGCVSDRERKKLASLHNNVMYLHPRLELVAYVCVCVRAHGPKLLQRTMAKERKDTKNSPRRGHGIIVFPKCPFPVVLLRADPPADPSACLFPPLACE